MRFLSWACSKNAHFLSTSQPQIQMFWFSEHVTLPRSLGTPRAELCSWWALNWMGEKGKFIFFMMADFSLAKTISISALLGEIKVKKKYNAAQSCLHSLLQIKFYVSESVTEPRIIQNISHAKQGMKPGIDEWQHYNGPNNTLRPSSSSRELSCTPVHTFQEQLCPKPCTGRQGSQLGIHANWNTPTKWREQLSSQPNTYLHAGKRLFASLQSRAVSPSLSIMRAFLLW